MLGGDDENVAMRGITTYWMNMIMQAASVMILKNFPMFKGSRNPPQVLDKTTNEIKPMIHTEPVKKQVSKRKTNTMFNIKTHIHRVDMW